MKKSFLFIFISFVIFLILLSGLVSAKDTCTDTDGGRNTNIQGTVTYIDKYGQKQEVTDCCVAGGESTSCVDYADTSYVKEYYCSEGEMKYEIIECVREKSTEMPCKKGTGKCVPYSENPKAIIGSPITGKNYQVGETITFDASKSTPSGKLYYCWDFGDGTTSKGSEQQEGTFPPLSFVVFEGGIYQTWCIRNPITTHVYDESGSKLVKLKVIVSGSLLSDTESRTILVDDPNKDESPAVSILLPDSDQYSLNVNLKGQVLDDETDSDKIKVLWDLGDDSYCNSNVDDVCKPNSEGITEFTHTYLNADTYEIILTAKDSSGQTSEATKKFSVLGGRICEDGTLDGKCSIFTKGKKCICENEVCELKSDCGGNRYEGEECGCFSGLYCYLDTGECGTPKAKCNELDKEKCLSSPGCYFEFEGCKYCSSEDEEFKNQKIESCSDYSDGISCATDSCGAGLNGIGTENCNKIDEYGNIIENCKCAWQNNECVFSYSTRSSNYRGTPETGTCTKSIIELEGCGEDGFRTVEIRYEGDGCPTDSEGNPISETKKISCGKAYSVLPFFTWFNLLVVLGILVLFYTLRKEKRKRGGIFN